MNLNIQSIATFAEKLRFKSLFQTKPAEFSRVNFGKSKILKNDVFVHSNLFFCKMTDTENALLPKELHNTKMGKAFVDVILEIRNQKTESCFVVKEDGTIIAKTESKDFGNAFMSRKDLNKLEKFKQKINLEIGCIHNHTIPITLSSQDLITFLSYNQKILIATTPNEGYAAIYRTKPANILTDRSVMTDLYKMKYNEHYAGLKIFRENSNLSNPEILEKMDNFYDEQLKRFVKKHRQYEIEYEYKKVNLSSEKTNENIPDFRNMYSNENIKKTFIDADRTLDEMKEFLNEIDSKKLEDLFI